MKIKPYWGKRSWRSIDIGVGVELWGGIELWLNFAWWYIGLEIWREE